MVVRAGACKGPLAGTQNVLHTEAAGEGNAGLDHWAMRDFTSEKKTCLALGSTMHEAEFLGKGAQ
jgi:hypothetical protein